MKTAAEMVRAIACDLAARTHEQFLSEMRRAALVLESPIEQVFLAALLSEDRLPLSADALVWRGRVELYLAGAVPEPQPAAEGIHVYVQTPIGRHRVDLAVFVKHQNDLFRFVVECDGHDFHEKTKDQAARDKRRDRQLTAAGFTVVRFTGREIWADPANCVGEFYSLIMARFEKG